MKRKNGNVEGSSSSKRNSEGCGSKQEEVQIDRISNLPDSVLAHILSFLPIQDAVKTVLLRRFGLLWATTDNLHLDACSIGLGYKKRFINFVRHVLILHDRKPIYRFHLNFYFSFRYSGREYFLQDPGSQKLVKREMRLANEINSWTYFAIKREVKVLDLDFLAYAAADIDDDKTEILYKIPDFVFNCDSVRELKLVSCRVEPKGQNLMRSLKTLFLKYVALNGNGIDEILSWLPSLESLSLIECYDLFTLNFVPPNLKYLKFVGRCESRLEISGPNITSLDISGSIEQVHLKNLCALKDATLGFWYPSWGWGEGRFHEVRKILENLNHAKVLTIYEEDILGWFIWASIKISFAPMTWKHIILSTGWTSWYLPGIASMLRASPCLEMLDIHINSHFCYSVEQFVFYGHELDVEKYWNEHEESFRGHINNLRTVRTYGCVTHSDVPPLVQFLLKNSMSLEKMVITSRRSNDLNLESYYTSDQLLKLSQTLLSFPRASNSAVILIS